MTDYILSHYNWKIAVYVYAGILLVSCFFGALIRPLELTEIKNSKSSIPNDPNGRYNEASSKIKASEPMENVCFDKDFQTRELQCAEGEYSRKRSIVQIHGILEDNKAMDTELVFQPKKRRGSKVYLPPLALNDTFCDKPVSDMKLNKKENSDSLDTCPVEKFINRRFSVIDLGALDKDFEGKGNTKSLFQTLDRSLWCNPALWVLILHRLLANFSQCIFFMFLPILIIDAGFTLNQASLMIMVTGITNTVARFISGLLMDRPEVNSFILTAGGFFIQAILLCIFPFCSRFIILMVLSGIVGVVVAPFQIGMAILAGEMLPVDKVASACGLMSFAQAIGNIIGPPLIGFIYDNHKDHVIIFFITAIGYLMSGISCWISGCLYARQKTNIKI